MTEELKPCPFCGGEAEQKKLCGNIGNIKQIVCKTCGAHNLWDSLARKFWNKRTLKDTNLKPCPICGKKGRALETGDGKFCIQCVGCYLTTGDFETPEAAKAAWNRRSYSNV